MSKKPGYRSPPEETQFKKGTSGNPKGRPKGSKNFKTLLEHHFAKPVTITVKGKKKTVSSLEAMAMKVVNNALGADPKQMLGSFAIMQKTGFLAQEAAEPLAPDNYEELLEEYAQSIGMGSTKPG